MKKERINERIREKLDSLASNSIRRFLYDLIWWEYLNRGVEWKYTKKYESLADKHSKKTKE